MLPIYFHAVYDHDVPSECKILPVDIIEAARIDGLSEIGIFFQMYMPTMKSTYAAAAVITFMNAWNYYLWPKVIMTDNKMLSQCQC